MSHIQPSDTYFCQVCFLCSMEMMVTDPHFYSFLLLGYRFSSRPLPFPERLLTHCSAQLQHSHTRVFTLLGCFALSHVSKQPESKCYCPRHLLFLSAPHPRPFPLGIAPPGPMWLRWNCQSNTRGASSGALNTNPGLLCRHHLPLWCLKSLDSSLWFAREVQGERGFLPSQYLL